MASFNTTFIVSKNSFPFQWAIWGKNESFRSMKNISLTFLVLCSCFSIVFMFLVLCSCGNVTPTGCRINFFKYPHSSLYANRAGREVSPVFWNCKLYTMYSVPYKKSTHCDKISVIMLKNVARPTGYNKRRRRHYYTPPPPALNNSVQAVGLGTKRTFRSCRQTDANHWKHSSKFACASGQLRAKPPVFCNHAAITIIWI